MCYMHDCHIVECYFLSLDLNTTGDMSMSTSVQPPLVPLIDPVLLDLPY
jgi:hypothetical protein